jgi:hypothetical protein
MCGDEDIWTQMTDPAAESVNLRYILEYLAGW